MEFFLLNFKVIALAVRSFKLDILHMRQNWFLAAIEIFGQKYHESLLMNVRHVRKITQESPASLSSGKLPACLSCLDSTSIYL